MFNLEKWNPDATYAIFDDWEDWTRFYNYKQWLGAQFEFEISDKYKRKQTIIWGKPCIVVSNDLPDFKDMQWIYINCIIVEIKHPLF